MVVAEEKCGICGKQGKFTIGESAVLLREARCEHCGASLRNSDTAKQILHVFAKSRETEGLKQVNELNALKILNTCSSGYLHEVLKDYE